MSSQRNHFSPNYKISKQRKSTHSYSAVCYGYPTTKAMYPTNKYKLQLHELDWDYSSS